MINKETSGIQIGDFSFRYEKATADVRIGFPEDLGELSIPIPGAGLVRALKKPPIGKARLYKAFQKNASLGTLSYSDMGIAARHTSSTKRLIVPVEASQLPSVTNPEQSRTRYSRIESNTKQWPEFPDDITDLLISGDVLIPADTASDPSPLLKITEPEYFSVLHGILGTEYTPEDRERFAKWSQFSHAVAEFSTVHGHADGLRFTKHALASFYLNDLIFTHHRLRMWDVFESPLTGQRSDIALIYAMANFHREHTALARALNIDCNLEGQKVDLHEKETDRVKKYLDQRVDPSKRELLRDISRKSGYLRENMFWFSHTLYDILTDGGQGSLVECVSPERPGHLAAAITFLFGLVKSGLYKEYLTEQEVETMVNNLTQSESAAQKYSFEHAAVKSIISSGIGMVKDALVADRAPLASGMVNTIQNGDIYPTYLHRMDSGWNFDLTQLGLKTLDEYTQKEGLDGKVRIAPKSNISTLGKALRSELSLFEDTLDSYGVSRPDPYDSQFMWDYQASVALHKILEPNTSLYWRVANRDQAKMTDQLLDGIVDKIRQTNDVVRNSLFLPPRVIDRVMDEIFNERSDMKVRFVFDHDGTPNPRIFDVKNIQDLCMLADAIGIQGDKPTPSRLLHSWIQHSQKDEYPYAGIHLYSQINLPVGFPGKVTGEVSQLVQTRVFHIGHRAAIDNTRIVYKSHPVKPY
jgi:hypothetical protein